MRHSNPPVNGRGSCCRPGLPSSYSPRLLRAHPPPGPATCSRPERPGDQAGGWGPSAKSAPNPELRAPSPEPWTTHLVSQTVSSNGRRARGDGRVHGHGHDHGQPRRFRDDAHAPQHRLSPGRHTCSGPCQTPVCSPERRSSTSGPGTRSWPEPSPDRLPSCRPDRWLLPRCPPPFSSVNYLLILPDTGAGGTGRLLAPWPVQS